MMFTDRDALGEALMEMYRIVKSSK